MLFAAFVVMGMPQKPTAEYLGDDVGVRILKSGHEYVVQYLARAKDRTFVLVAASPTSPGVRSIAKENGPNLLSGVTEGLFTRPPSLGFTDVKIDSTNAGATIHLWRDDAVARIEQVLTVPMRGDIVKIDTQATMKGANPAIRYLLNTVAFVPGGKGLSDGGHPDTTYAPAIRPNAQNVIGDHFYRSPAVVAQTGAISAILIPDLDVLTQERRMPTIVDVDCANGVVDAALLSYGFCDYRLVGHVYYANDASMVRPFRPSSNSVRFCD